MFGLLAINMDERSRHLIFNWNAFSFLFSQYNPQFGDAFWNSSKYNMVSYLLRMMTSWAIVCDVWDGGLKRAKVKDTFKEEQQKNYSKMIVGNESLNSEAN
ncbi:Glycerol-3-phosphate acyltransferase 3 [Camelus dromedarius]|uniref:Glycerol-3-phosphate acyltransferase 3 n=1 Tax=Camelus dromedarius TaxID=9838 RepID=A0A5N4EHG6_CAMDR|nr:Glycerol-3-phosphate acyltransferase 3 [Camelus dromedarius]